MQKIRAVLDTNLWISFLISIKYDVWGKKEEKVKPFLKEYVYS
jgi:predicted nucleic acid-binding protein